MPAVVIKAGAGVGKTAIAIQEIVKADLRMIEYYVPTLALAIEVKNRIQELSPNLKVVVIRGRGQEDENGKSMCSKYQLAQHLSERGFPVYPNLCVQSRGSQQTPIRCEHHSSCSYITQFSKAEVRIYTHAYLPLERGFLEGCIPDAVFIDESFWKECIEAVPVPLQLLTHDDLPVIAKPLCAAIARALQTSEMNVLQAIRDAYDDGTYFQIQRKLKSKLGSVLAPDMSEVEVRRQLASVTSFKRVAQLLEALESESRFQREKIQSITFIDSQTILVHRKRPIRRFQDKSLRRALGNEPPIIIIDASAALPIVEQFFRVAEFEELTLRRNATIIQCHSTWCSTSSINPNAHVVECMRSAAERRLSEVQKLIDSEAAAGEKVLVVGPTAVVGNPKQNKPALLNAPNNIEFAHFQALRGIDCWRNFDVVIVIGRNQPATKDVENIARALFCDDAKPLDLTGEWDIVPRGFRIEGKALGVNTQVHRDNRVQIILEQIRERESEQALDRLRLIHNNASKRVILLSNLPLHADVSQLLTWDEIINGGSRVERAANELDSEILPFNAKWLAKRFPHLWATDQAAKQDSRRYRKKVQRPSKDTIRNLYPFEYEYKTAYQRTWSRCLSRFSTEDETQEALLALIGEPVTMRSIF